MMRRALYEPILAPAVSLVSPCFAYRFKRDDETDRQYVDRLADELEAEFQRLGADRVIAFIAEPVVGATTGCVRRCQATSAVCARSAIAMAHCSSWTK